MPKNNKISGIVEGNIQNTETGETTNVRHYLFCSGFEFTAIAKIENIESYELPDNSFQVSVDCNGLDSVGFVFRLGLNFTADSEAQKDRILNDLKVNSVFIFRGPYTAGEDAPQHIVLNDPHYEPVYPHFSEEEIRKVFSINEKGLEKSKKA